MNNYWKTLRIFLPMVLLLSALVLPAAYTSATSGLGVTPSSLVFTDVLPGSSSQKEVQVFNLAGSPREVLAKKTGSTANWISFLPSDTIPIAGGSTGTLTVVVRPPQGTGPGTYKGEIQIVVKPTADKAHSGGAGAEITPGAVLSVSVSVGGTAKVALDLVSGEVISPEVEKPLPSNLVMENSGNVVVTPSVKVDILDTQQKAVIKSFTQALEPIPPAVRAQPTINLPTEGLEQQTNYWAKITVTLDGAVVGELSRTFDIKKPGGLCCVGYLTAIHSPSFGSVGEEVQITAIFKNTGESTIQAQFEGTVAKGNKTAATLLSPKVSISPGTDGKLISFFTSNQQGDYIISGRIRYGGELHGGELHGGELLNHYTETMTAQYAAYAHEAEGAAQAQDAVPAIIGKDWVLLSGVAFLVLLQILVIFLLWSHVRGHSAM